MGEIVSFSRSEAEIPVFGGKILELEAENGTSEAQNPTSDLDNWDVDGGGGTSKGGWGRKKGVGY